MAVVKPIGSFTEVQPTGGYISQPFFTGLLEGYNTMDALASLAFAIVLINAIKEFEIKDAKEIAKITLRSGVLAVALMAVIYFGLTILGAQSALLQGANENGGVALAILAKHYYGAVGNVLLAGIMIFACLKTAIGLVTSCAETFVEVFPKTVSLSNLCNWIYTCFIPFIKLWIRSYTQVFFTCITIPISNYNRIYLLTTSW